MFCVNSALIFCQLAPAPTENVGVTCHDKAGLTFIVSIEDLSAW